MAMRRKTVWGGKVSGTHAGSGFGRTGVLALVLLILSSAPLWAQSRARLSSSLEQHIASRSAAPVDVIVHGSRRRGARDCRAPRAAHQEESDGGRRAAGDRRPASRRSAPRSITCRATSR